MRAAIEMDETGCISIRPPVMYNQEFAYDYDQLRPHREADLVAYLKVSRLARPHQRRGVRHLVPRETGRRLRRRQARRVFFSSRRRHTRLVSDWSSDVCSSD